MTERNQIPWQLSHIKQLRGRAMLPAVPTETAILHALNSWYSATWEQRINDPHGFMHSVLSAAYAIDSACSDHPLTDQEAAEAANLETLSGYNDTR